MSPKPNWTVGDFTADSVDTERLSVVPQDLSILSLGSSDDGDMYYHNGNSSITVDGSSTSDTGYVRWNNNAGEWTAVEGGGGIGGTSDPLGIPSSATASGTDSVAVGQDSTADGAGGVALGDGASAADSASVAIGRNAGGSFSPENSIAIGDGAPLGRNNIHIGDLQGSAQKDSLVVGPKASGGSSQSVTVLGRSASSSANGTVALGSGATVATAGVGRVSSNQWVFGGVRDTVSDADLNNSELTVELDETNNAFRLRGKDSGGTVREATIAW